MQIGAAGRLSGGRVSQAFHQLTLPECQTLLWSALSPTAQFPGCYACEPAEGLGLAQKSVRAHLGVCSASDRR